MSRLVVRRKLGDTSPEQAIEVDGRELYLDLPGGAVFRIVVEDGTLLVQPIETAVLLRTEQRGAVRFLPDPTPGR